jgi:hypothetical protein
MTFSEEKSRVIKWSAIWEWLSDQDNRDKLTFLGGVLSGGAAAIWAIFKWIVPLIREYLRRPQLSFGKPVLMGFPPVAQGQTRQGVTVDVTNVGSSPACSCRARAKTTKGQPPREVPYLHWAGTSHDDSSEVDIAPGDHKRLDVIFTQNDRPDYPGGCYLATPRALSGSFSGDAELKWSGKYQLEIRVTCTDGVKAKLVLPLPIPPTWDRLEESFRRRSWLHRALRAR